MALRPCMIASIILQRMSEGNNVNAGEIPLKRTIADLKAVAQRLESDQLTPERALELVREGAELAGRALRELEQQIKTDEI